MRPITAILGSCAVIAAAAFYSCTKDKVTESYTFFRPVYETSAQTRDNIKSDAPQPVESPGKLAVKGSYLYLTELGKGVHIIDYSNPKAPQNISFINIPGNADISVRGNYLYADCYTALAVIDITNPQQVKLNKFLNGVFPDRFSGLSSDTDKVIITWQQVDTVVTRTFSESFDKTLDGNVIVYNDMVFASQFSSGGKSNAGGITNSTNGSLARFALVDDRMYVVGYSFLRVFNTADASSPFFVKNAALSSNDIETIFPYKNNLFIGSRTGVHIYSISDKDNPTKLSVFTHAQKCDPVVADGNYAYVTLRSGTPCAATQSNQLDVLDVTNLSSPTLVKTYGMTNPYGLAKEGNLLFICDGTAGLKILDAAAPDDIKPLGVLPGLTAYDIVALNGVALLSATDAFYFVDYSNPAHPVILSQLSVTK